MNDPQVPVLRLTLRMALFLVLLHLASYALAAAFFDFGWIVHVGYPGDEIYVAIEKAAHRTPPPNVRMILLGDSVANQGYNVKRDHGDIWSLTANQAIELPGMSVLLDLALDTIPSNQPPPEVVLAVIPWTLEHDLDQVFTYHYFIKPFSQAELRARLSPEERAWMTAFPAARWASLPEVRLSTWKPDAPVPSGAGKGFAFAALRRMAAKCHARGIRFRMICPPIRESRMTEAHEKIAAWPRDAELTPLIEAYEATIVGWPDDRFRDGAHYADPKLLGPHPFGL